MRGREEQRACKFTVTPGSSHEKTGFETKVKEMIFNSSVWIVVMSHSECQRFSVNCVVNCTGLLPDFSNIYGMIGPLFQSGVLLYNEHPVYRFVNRTLHLACQVFHFYSLIYNFAELYSLRCKPEVKGGNEAKSKLQKFIKFGSVFQENILKCLKF